MTKRVMRAPTPSLPLFIPGESLSQTEKVEALANTLETRFYPVADPSVPAVIEVVDVALGSYYLTPELRLTNFDEVHEAIRVLKVGKVQGPNGIPNRALKHHPLRAESLLVRIYNAILITHQFPSLWKHARVGSIIKPGRIRHYHHLSTH